MGVHGCQACRGHGMRCAVGGVPVEALAVLDPMVFGGLLVRWLRKRQEGIDIMGESTTGW